MYSSHHRQKSTPEETGGTFDVSMTMGDSTWALPMLKGLVGPEKIDSGFIDEILGQMGYLVH